MMATVDRLLGHLFLVTGDLHAAEEIVQEAFTRLRCVVRTRATTMSLKPGMSQGPPSMGCC
jgi:DNA-directed RNA polymerase specialized sigma24 family protein